MSSCPMIVEHLQNNKLQTFQKLQSLNILFLKYIKIKISSLIWTVENISESNKCTTWWGVWAGGFS